MKIKRLWLRYRMAAIMLTAWEPMVASATPATPRPAPFTRAKSPMMLRAQDKVMKSMGLRESP